MSKIVKDMSGKDEYSIPEILNWEDYRYCPALECNCGHINVYSGVNIYTWGVGVCETPYGTMVCCECPKCGDRIRFHIADLSYLTLYHDEWKII